MNSIQEIAGDIVAKEYFSTDHRDALSENGYSLLSSVGTDRLVFSKNKYEVLKIARNKELVDLNYDEAAVWSESKDRNIFCPITETGPHYRWIKMVRCEPTPNKIEEYEEKIRLSDWKIPDLHSDNIGICQTTGKLVCFDYPNAFRV